MDEDSSHEEVVMMRMRKLFFGKICSNGSNEGEKMLVARTGVMTNITAT